jgi:hypothetical protein
MHDVGPHTPRQRGRRVLVRPGVHVRAEPADAQNAHKRTRAYKKGFSGRMLFQSYPWRCSALVLASRFGRLREVPSVPKIPMTCVYVRGGVGFTNNGRFSSATLMVR